MTLSSGAILGPYSIVAPLGAGGMGEVYRAKDTRLDRDVAIKVLPPHLSRSPEFKQRFEREAKSISQLTHAHICTLHDVGHHDGTDYLVMELLEGETVAQRVTKGSLPLDAVLMHGVEIASALDAAHRKGVVHRDLKPGNIMLTKSGAKLLDFGLAKSAAIIESDPSAVTVSQPLTSKGTILGTFQYMAPEQLEGVEADARTDIFAFGAVLYEMATGKRAFEGHSRASLIASIMSAQPRPLSELQPMTPPALDRLIRKCLAKDPDHRWQSAADVADELRWIAEDDSQPIAAATRAGRGWRFGTGLLAGILVSVAVALIALALRTKPELRATHVSIALPASDVVDAGLENLAITLSPDGRSVAYCARGVSGIHLYLRRLDQREAIKLPGTEGAYDPFFSPDSEWIGFFAGSKLRKISVRGGVSIPLADSIESRSGTWIDEQTIAFAPNFGTPLMQLPASGGTPQPITALDVNKRERTHRWPEALPGGEWVLFTTGSIDSPGDYDASVIEAVSTRTRERRVLVTGGRMARFAPPGFLVFARGSVLFAARIDPRDPRVTAAPLPVLDGVGGEATSGASHFSISHDGTLAYLPGATDELDELVWVDMEGKIEPVGAPLRLYNQVRVSPDGTQLLVAAGPARAVGDLWLYSLARETSSRVTFDQKCSSPCWTPDQRRVVYRIEAGQYQIRVQPLDGSEAPRVIHSDADPVLVSGITPDGSTVLFQKYGSGTSDVLVVPIDGSAPARPLWEEPSAQYSGVVSPDGRWLAYTSQEGGIDDIYVKPASGQGGKWQVSVDGGIVPVWSPDGKELFFVRGDTMMSVTIDAREGQVTAGTPKKLFDFPPGRRAERDLRTFDITPDGKRFVLMRSATPGLGRREINVVLNWNAELDAKMPARK
jgi:Tol biopolymer transport system component/tRNA A-37 threonylcarbamoyl transferase component Bud32